MGSYAGVDWASEEHAVLVEDDSGEVIVEATFAHDESGIGRLCELLVSQDVQRVAIERPDGLLVERLLDAGLCVLALQPNQLYTDARARGHDHQRAIRTVGRGWTRVLWRIWQDHTTYDPTQHRALTRQTAT